MDAVLNWVWQGALVALALGAMLRLIDRARANVRYLVCWSALLIVIGLPVLPWLDSGGLRPPALGAVPADALLSVPDAWWTSSAVMASAWVIWASVYVMRFAWAVAALRGARTRSEVFPSHLESRLTCWTRVRGKGRRAALVVSDAVPAAALLGGAVPLIAVSPALVIALDTGDLDRVLVHEWAHVQRRDDVVNVLQVVLRIVAGWHPAVWWIERRLRVEREIACDETAVAVTGSPRLYAECLMKLASLDVSSRDRSALPAPAVLTASGLGARVRRILSCRGFIAPWWSRGIATGIVSVLCVVALGIGSLKLVEASAFALPLESIRTVAVRSTSLEPVVLSTAPAPIAVAASRRTVVPASAGRRQVQARPQSPVPVAPDAEPQRTPDPPRAEETIPQQAVGDDHADGAPAHERWAPPDAARVQATEVAAAREQSPWADMADRGTALGRKSKDAGLATAGFFTRFGRRVAGSF